MRETYLYTQDITTQCHSFFNITFSSGLCGSAGLTAWENHKKLKGRKFTWISKDVKGQRKALEQKGGGQEGPGGLETVRDMLIRGC